MKPTKSVGLGAVAAMILAQSAIGQGISKEALASAAKELRAPIDRGEVAGASLMVSRDGKTLLFDTVGLRDIQDRAPFTKYTLLRIYSMTKPLTSVAAMILLERGKFHLDDPVSMHIPAFAEMRVLEGEGTAAKLVPPKRPPTVRDVLRHTTGHTYGDSHPEAVKAHARERLRYHGPHEMYPPRMTIEAAANALARIPALHHPGERFTYGFGTDLLGRLIEVWSGQPLDQFMNSALFEPLQMVDTGFSIPIANRPRLGSCHSWSEGKLVVVDKAATSPFNEGFEFLSGGGGLISTIGDYANFCQMLVDGGLFHGRRLLKEETIRLMFTDQLDGVAGPFRFGLGFAIDEVPLGSAPGARKAMQYSWGGYASTDFRLIPEERFFQILMRQEVPASNALANKIFATVREGFE